MTETVTSADGTRIAFEPFGDGPAVILIGGMFCDRRAHRALAEQLADRFTAITLDRRGRGDSGDTVPYAVEREVEDLAAVIGDVGGRAAAYGHSSGAGLALRAASAGVPITRLVLHEPPYGDDDDESRRAARELAEAVRSAIDASRPGDAIKLFLAAMGTPPETAEEMSADPGMLRIAPTMPYDHEVMGDSTDGGVIPAGLVTRVTMPTLVLAGDTSPEFFRHTAERLVDLLPDGRYELLAGQDHGAPAEVVAPAVARFIGVRSP